MNNKMLKQWLVVSVMVWLVIVPGLVLAQGGPERPPITAANADQVQSLHMIGRGRLTDLAWADTLLTAFTGVGAWHYDTTDLSVEPRFEETANGTYSPDGSLWVEADWDTLNVRVWDTATGDLVYDLSGHIDTVRDFAFNPDGSLLASAGAEGTVYVWDMATGEQQYTMDDHRYGANAVAFSADGSLLATGTGDGMIGIWSMNSGQPFMFLPTISVPISSLAFSPDGMRLAAGNHDQRVQVWDLTTRYVTQELTGHTRPVSCLAFSPTGDQLVSGSNDGTLRIWDMATGETVQALTGYNPPAWWPAITFGADSSTLFTYYGAEVETWDAATGALQSTLPVSITSHTNRRNIDFHAGQNLLAVGGTDGVQVWDMAQLEPVLTLDHGLTPTFNADGTQLALGAGPALHILDALTGEELNVMDVVESNIGPQAVIWSPDGMRLAYRILPTVFVWDIATESQIYYRPTPVHLNTIAWAGDYLAGGDSAFYDAGGHVYLWDAETGELIYDMTGHTNMVWDVAFSPDGSLLASAGRDGTIRVWDTSTGQEVAVLSGHNDEAYALDFSPDGSLLASAGMDGTVRVWGVPDPA
jgi:WD40 repeat protein